MAISSCPLIFGRRAISPRLACAGGWCGWTRVPRARLSAHALPEAAARVAGEALALGALLGTRAEAGRRLTVQTKADGPLDLVTADYYGADEDASHRGVRGYARLDAARFAALESADFATLAGKGALAITIEPRLGGQTYQGIVALSPDGIGRVGGNLFRPVRAIAHRDPAGGRAALCGGREPAALARRRHHAADDAGGRQARRRAGRARAAPMTGSGCRCCSRRSRIWNWWTPSLRPRPCCGGCSTKTRCGCSRAEPVDLPLRLRHRPHRPGAEELCAGGARRPGRSRRHHPRPLRILRQHARDRAGVTHLIRLALAGEGGVPQHAR